jgi:hypothetical protein
MYIFAKFVPDHIFLQNHDKINIKKLWCWGRPVVVFLADILRIFDGLLMFEIRVN